VSVVITLSPIMNLAEETEEDWAAEDWLEEEGEETEDWADEDWLAAEELDD